MSETAHTPTPWHVDSKAAMRVVAGASCTVATTGCQGDIRESWEANAAFIVRAVNSHDALVAAISAATCPAGGWNGMPKELECRCTVADCFRYGTCGCNLGAALSLATKAPTSDARITSGESQHGTEGMVP